MKRNLKVALPSNLDRNDLCNFKIGHYDLPLLKVLEIIDAIVTNDGICLSDKALIKESVHGYSDKITIYTLKAIFDLLNYPTFQINDSNSYLIIHSPLFSYYHWFTESIPRLFLVKKQLKNLILLLPQSLRKVEFIQASLKAFSFSGIFYIPRYTNIRLNHLILPQIKPYFTSYYPEVVSEIRNLYTTLSKRYHINLKNFKGRIFLCDEKVVSNIYDVRSLLYKYNFLYINIPAT